MNLGTWICLALAGVLLVGAGVLFVGRTPGPVETVYVDGGE